MDLEKTISILNDMMNKYSFTMSERFAISEAIKLANSQKTGKWIYERGATPWEDRFRCSVCKHIIYDSPGKRCPDCGAIMEKY